MKIVTVSEMREIEREADQQGWTYANMMESAGRGLAEVVMSLYGYEEDLNVVGLVGSGNNGGDTLIALALLAEVGWTARAYLALPRPDDDPLVEHTRAAGVELLASGDDDKFRRLDAWLDDACVLLDGVLGTGVRLPLKAPVARLLGHVRDYPALPDVVAVDCPSGIDLENGAAAPETIPAEVTVCMAAVKTGLLASPASQLAGALEVVDIGLPADLPAWQSVRRALVTEDDLSSIMPARKPDSHKGTYGTVCVTAGSLNYTGAALLCAEGAYRIGAGLVQIAAPAPLHTALAGQIPEATWVLLPHEMGVLSEGAVEILRKHLDKVTVLLFGPGFGVEDPTAAFVRRLWEGKGPRQRGGVGFIAAQPEEGQGPAPHLPPLVIDADGLKLLARVDDWPARLPAPAVLTPHPGEMSILTGLSVKEIQSDRLETAARFAAQWGHVVVLKGANTVVAEPDGQVRVIPVATSALAHGGTGDVLAGMIAGLRAQGMPAFEAAFAGAWIHAQTGLLAAEYAGHEASVLAGDLLDALPEVLSWVW
jgi:ADP-dependent NAD(P)H-hydrate dehydratase / NAD(P)H-hydrate epimerase